MSTHEKGLDDSKINEELNEDDENENKINEEEEKRKEEEEKKKKEEEEKRKDSGLDLTDDKDFEHMKEELDKATNFIDYFLTVGLPPKIFLESSLYELDIDELNEKFKESWQPKVTSYFPPFEKHTIAFDDSVILHCFPKGFKAIPSTTQPKIKLFSFILDNNYFNLNFPQKYLTCLICYENITKYKELYDCYQRYMTEENLTENDIETRLPRSKREGLEEGKRATIQSLTDLYTKNGMIEGILGPRFNEPKQEKNKNKTKVKDENIYIPKCLMIMSLYPYFAEYEKILTEIYNYSLIVDDEAILTREKTLNIPANLNKSLEIIQPSFTVANLENHIKKDNSQILIPIDKIIENLLIELPVPPRGIFSVEYTLINEERKLKQNLMNELPLVDINLKRLFTFDIKEIVDMYHNLFLETRILFFSEDIQSLNMYIFGLLSLLYPFQYQYQVVTILPEENFEIIESITPFIAGINMPYTEDFFESRDLTLSDGILIVDIDNTKIEFVNKMSEIPEFPKGYRKTLEKNLQNIKLKYFKNGISYKSTKTIKPGKVNQSDSSMITKLSSIETDNRMNLSTVEGKLEGEETNENINKTQTIYFDDSKKNEFEIIPDIGEELLEEQNSIYGNFKINFEFNKEVNELFFNFNANLLSGYNKFLNTDFYSSNNAPCLEVLFKVDEFLNQVSSADRAFYDKFISETQIFGDFLYMRMIPKNTKEKIQILAFDEKINENSASFFSSAPVSVFINSKEYKFVNKYKVQKPRQLTKEEIEFYRKDENKIKLLNYGIIIKEDPSTNQIVFEYPIFPNLTTKYFFKNNITEYFLPMNLNENVESINTDIVAKSHLGGVAMRLNDMDNYIYLCWMQMWAITFWYCDQKERRYRFQELLKVLNKTSSHEMEIFNLLFETLSIYGEDYMVLKLYDILLTLHLNPSFKVHNIVMKLLDKKKLEGKIRENLQNAFKDELKNDYRKEGFRNRTFKSKYYGNILTEDIIFFAFDGCMDIDCQKEIIDLEYASMNFKAMDRELTWTKCPKCGTPILPKLSVQFGKEINKIGKMKENTCKLDSVVLFSPLDLKNNYNSVALRSYGVKLDVEDLLLKYNNIFWNSLWYFKLKHLEYDFMLPYEEGLEKEVDDYLDISIGDDEEKEIKKYNKEKYVRNFEVDSFKPDKLEIHF